MMNVLDGGARRSPFAASISAEPCAVALFGSDEVPARGWVGSVPVNVTADSPAIARKEFKRCSVAARKAVETLPGAQPGETLPPLHPSVTPTDASCTWLKNCRASSRLLVSTLNGPTEVTTDGCAPTAGDKVRRGAPVAPSTPTTPVAPTDAATASAAIRPR